MIGLILFCIVYYFLAGLAVALGYHRCLTHRAFRMKKYFEYFVVFLGLPAGTPIQWVGNHRFHHIHSDEDKDPHSPIVHGFWYAHNGWYINSRNSMLCFLYAIAGPIRLLIDAYLRPISNQQYNHLSKDVAKISFYKWLSKPSIYRCCMLLHLLVPYSFVWYFWGLKGVFFLWLTQIIVYNLGDAVNSLGHEEGESEYGKNNQALNHPLLALLTFGDGYHANHHQYPSAANLNFKKKGIDFGWIIILVLQKFNLVYNIKSIEGGILKKDYHE